MSTALDAFCALHGVASEYTDIWGETQHASDETRCAILKALGVIGDGEDLERAAQEPSGRLLETGRAAGRGLLRRRKTLSAAAEIQGPQSRGDIPLASRPRGRHGVQRRIPSRRPRASRADRTSMARSTSRSPPNGAIRCRSATMTGGSPALTRRTHTPPSSSRPNAATCRPRWKAALARGAPPSRSTCCVRNATGAWATSRTCAPPSSNGAIVARASSA